MNRHTQKEEQKNRTKNIKQIPLYEPLRINVTL